ncbi:MAG: OmpW family outer membrane protein [Chitinophagaceae bacterium]
MKKYSILVALLMAGVMSFAQSSVNGKAGSKWAVRLRVIGAVPPSSSYNLSGSDVKISSSVMPEVDFSYYFTKNLSAELILGTTHHTVKLENSSGSATLGKVWLLPPTLNLQYHLPVGNFIPYVGAGINYTIFYGTKDEAASLSYKNKAGFSTQLGFDYNLSDKWFINVDAKKVWLKTDVTVKGTEPTVLSGVKVNPYIFGIGIGTRF